MGSWGKHRLAMSLKRLRNWHVMVNGSAARTWKRPSSTENLSGKTNFYCTICQSSSRQVDLGSASSLTKRQTSWTVLGSRALGLSLMVAS